MFLNCVAKSSQSSPKKVATSPKLSQCKIVIIIHFPEKLVKVSNMAGNASTCACLPQMNPAWPY